MEDDTTNRNKSIEPYFIQFIIGFVTFSGYISDHQINFSSNQLIKALNIFPHKVNIYMCKLFGLRSVLTIIGALTNHLITVYYSKNYVVFSIVSLCSIFFTRLILLIVLYKSITLSFYFFIILSLEAFVSGFFQNSLFLIVPEYTSTIILSIDISLIFSLGIKLIVCYFCKERDIIIIKVELWISLSINTISIGLLLFYNFYYYNEYSNYYNEGIKKLKEILEDWRVINSCMKKIESTIQPLDQMLVIIDEMDKLQMKDVIDNKINTQRNILEELKNKLAKEHSEFIKPEGFEKTKKEMMNKLQEFCKKINESNDSYKKSRTFDHKFKKTSKIFELYNDITKLTINNQQINEKIEIINNIKEETDRIRVKIGEINENIQTINRFINYVDHRSKDHYTDMSNKLKKSKLDEESREIKGNIVGFKGKMSINEILNKIKPQITNLEEKMDSDKTNFFINVKRCLNQYLTVVVASIFKNFLYPKIIPQSVIESDKCQLIEKIATSFYLIGSLCIFSIYSHIDNFQDFKHYLDFLGVFNLIPFVIFVISLMAIHTKINIFRKLICSQYKMLPIISILILSFRIVESYTYVSISDNVEWAPQYNYSISVLTFHHILTIVYSYLFDKLSKGYKDSMLSLGYTVPFLDSNNKRNDIFCYLFKNTFKNTFKNIIFDLKINIREYI